MIPRVIHQTWKTDVVPERFHAFQRSWTEKNPGWTYMLWSDRSLLDFVSQNYPELLETYCGYETGVRRADAARYMLLHHFGGVYADVDAECLASLEPLVSEDRLVLCEEPPSHWELQLKFRPPIKRLLFNGVMASPRGHRFWPRLLTMLPEMRNVSDTLDATGPCLLSHLVQDDPEPETISVHSCQLFNGVDVYGHEVAVADQAAPAVFARHHWAGTWYPHPKPRTFWSTARKRYYKLRHRLTRGRVINPEKMAGSIDTRLVAAPPPSGDRLAILVPVRNGADHLESFLRAIATFDVPKDKIKLVFCEGDSTDGTLERLTELTAKLRGDYRDIRILQKPLGSKIPQNKRWKSRYQRVRRSNIAKVRNHLIDHGLDDTDDWAMWIDIDMWKFPSDIFAQLRRTGARIVTPNAVHVPGGSSFDLNSFVQQQVQRDYRYFRDHLHGLYQPPMGTWGRLYLSDLRYLERVELHGVGGTMLLVDAALHRAGLRFPERPYRNLIETEGFAALARDVGIIPIGLPKVEVLHVPW